MKSAEGRDRIYALWDRLVDFEASCIDEATDYLMTELCALAHAQNATSISGVRLEPKDDPLLGWRVPVWRTLHGAAPAKADERARAINDKWERREPDPAFLLTVRGVGAFRQHTLRRAMPPAWFESDHWQRFYRAAGVVDALFVGCPINEDAESHYSLLRVGDEPPFDDGDIEPVCEVLRGLKWFQRKLMLSHGLLVASAPITPAERRVLQGLLTGDSEKQIAGRVGMTYATTHQYVKKVFRKFGVDGRAGLQSLWIGAGART